MRPNVLSAPAEEEFRYGYRLVKKVLPDGTTDFEQVPLTLEDVLHPQEDDFIADNNFNERVARYLADVFAARRRRLPPFALVSHDLLVNWGVAGVGNHCPDVGVFVGLREDPGQIGTLDVRRSGARCELLVEAVSPSTRDNDVVHKVAHYHRVGVPLYVVIDQEVEGGPRALHVYRRGVTAYEEVPHDARGRVLLPVLGLYVGLRDDFPACYDADTGEYVADFEGQLLAREKAIEELRQFKDETDREMTAQVDKARRAESALHQAAQRIRDLEEQLRRLQSGGQP